jgi:hypothetical protein
MTGAKLVPCSSVALHLVRQHMIDPALHVMLDKVMRHASKFGICISTSTICSFRWSAPDALSHHHTLRKAGHA